MDDMLILSNMTPGQKARLARLALNWRQVDLASKASVSVEDIITLEKDRFLLPTRRKRILAVLGLLDNDNESD
jgi:transcriptional regulator with XRE-family HTH domain